MPTFESARSGLLWDATAVPNAFFCEYMPSAPDSHVKVYLYGLMLAHGGLSDDVDAAEELSRGLNMPPEEVTRALRYWERCRLVERISDDPPRYRFVSVQQVMLQRKQLPADEAYEAFAQAVYAAFGDRRKLHGGETVLAYEWVEQYHLPTEVVLMLIQHMISAHGVNFSFKDAQKVAMELCTQKVSTIEEADMVFSRSQAAMKGARKVLSHLGMRRSPTMDELDLYTKWTRDWGFAPDAILKACKETTKGAPNFAYLDKVLEGIRTRAGGEAVSEERMQETLAQEQAETAAVREILQTLGISLAVVDSGLRAQYHAMTQAFGGHEMVLLAAKTAVQGKNSPSLSDVENKLRDWHAKGLTDAGKVQAHFDTVRAQNAQLLKLKEHVGAFIGRNEGNRTLLARWQTEWGFDEEMILLAAEYARGTQSPMPFMNKVLEGWHESGVRDVPAARSEHEKHTAQGSADRSPAERPAASPKRVIEQQYDQRHYDPGEYDGIPEDQLEEMKKL